MYTTEDQENVRFELLERTLEDAKAFLQENYKFLYLHIDREDQKVSGCLCNVDFSRVNVELDNKKITKVSFG